MGGEWINTTLGSVLTLQRGFDLPETDRRPGSYLVIASTGVAGTHEEAKVLGPGVVIGRSGSLGGGQFIQSDFWPLNTTLWVKDFKGNDVRFCYYLLKSLDLANFNAGSGVPTLNRNHIHPLHVYVPSDVAEQRAIAHILGTLDDKIELNRRMSQTLEEMARAIFKSWFVDFDPVRAKAAVRLEHPDWTNAQVSRAACPGLKPEIAEIFPDRFVDSELGEIPEGWEVKSLDEIARFLNGLALQKYPPTGGRSLPVIKIAQLRSGNTSGADQSSADINSEYIVDNGDILFSWSGSLECVVWTGGKGALNQHLFKVSSNHYPRWLCYFSIHKHLEDFRRIAEGKATTMGHIQRHHLSGAKVAVPHATVLSILDKYMSPLFEASWKRNLETHILVALRDTFLPKLISGEIRIKDAERFLNERGI
jgi:type I restriction enzyme S subunit